MNTNHAKAIKGMSIANIVLAGLGILGMLALWAGLGAGGAAIDMSGYDYFYTDNGYYIEADDLASLLGGLTVLVCFMIICFVLVLIAGILGVRGAEKPEKMKSIMVWNIVGAVASFCGAGIISLVLCIVVAVFASKDRHLVAPAGMAYGTPYATPTPAQPSGTTPAPSPVASVSGAAGAVSAPAVTATSAATVPAAPAEGAATVDVVEAAAPVCDTGATPVSEAVVETVAEGTFAPAETAEEAQAAAAAPAVILPDNNVEDMIEGVTVIDVTDDADKPQA